MADATTTKREHQAAVIDARLAAAWLERCGPSGTPGDWISAEMLEILDDFNELSLHPTWAIITGDGSRMWSSSFKDRAGEEWWEWRISGVDEDSGMTRAAADAIDDLGASYGDRDVTFLSEGPHSERPAVPAEVVDAWLIIADDDSYEPKAGCDGV